MAKQRQNNGKMLILPVIFLQLLLYSCQSSTGSYQSSREYDSSLYSTIAARCIAYQGPLRNPVIVVHGFLGAKLKNIKTGRIAWGTYRLCDTFGFSDESLVDLACPMQIGKSLRELGGDVKPFALLDSMNVLLFGFPVQVGAYVDMTDLLQHGGYVLEGEKMPADKDFYSLFVFYYDWRRDLPYNAARLHEFVLQKRAYLQRRYEQLYALKNYDVQFDIIAHSMGGLLSRYYMRYGGRDLPTDGSLPKLDWKGTEYIDKLLIVGTPNAGYLDTCMEMVNGLKLSFGTPAYPPAVIGTFATYYQMMPAHGFRAFVYEDDQQGAEVDIFDLQTWIDLKWGLADPEQDCVLKKLLPQAKTAAERRKIALDHLNKCLRRAKQFQAAMRVPARHPSDVAMFLFAGDAVQTRRRATVNRKTGEIKVTAYGPGDGKILLSSARFDEREGGDWTPYLRSPIFWDSTIFLRAAHMGITHCESFVDNASFYLLVTPTAKQYRRSFIQERLKHRKSVQ